MSEKPQFDVCLGGSVELPAEIDYVKYAAARNKEIQIMKSNLSQTNSGTKLAFQRLPKHMRRRVMSHNVKRLPRRIREIHLSQLKKSGNSGTSVKAKRSSRKYKRRPRNLLEDYMRRRKKHLWLNTHIWHAKRFHMIEKWGYKLPDRPCDKAFRACYRATNNHCLIQDISYFSCIQIEGNHSFILNKFKLITDSNTSLTIGAKAYINGNREGTIMICHNELCKRPIGMVNFLWKPSSNNPSENRTIWFWVHAAYYNETLALFIELFNLQSSNTDADNRNLVQEYYNSETTIKLTELRFELNRFRLTGPLANAILQNALKIFDSSNKVVGWFNSFIENNDLRQIYANQKAFWEYLNNTKNVTELSPHMVLSAIVADPRFNFPKCRTKALPDFEKSFNSYQVPSSECCYSVLWDFEIRKQVHDSKIPNSKIAELRSNLLIPGTDLEGAVPVPVLIIQRPGCRKENLGYGSGWDIILPSTWAQSFWMSLIMWGARAGGLRESKSVAFEMGQECLLYPDTEAGKNEEDFIFAQCRNTFFKKPTNKRTNYNKLNIVSPFNWNWKLLLQNWTDSKDDKYSVIRNKQILNSLQVTLSGKNTEIDSSIFSENLLVPVKLKTVGKGLISQFAIICLPTDSDFKKEPIEPLKIDILQEKRKEMRCKHKELLKRLKQRRVRARKRGKVITRDLEMLKDYQSAMRKLWLPDSSDIKNSCSRQVIGFVKFADFSFRIGKSSAIGYIALGSIKNLLQNKSKNKVLVRNINSRQYRIVSMEVITE